MLARLTAEDRREKGEKAKQIHIAEDMQKYKLDILAIQETHTCCIDPGEIRRSDQKGAYMIYQSTTTEKNRAGKAISVRKRANVKFRPITDRVCFMKIKANDNYTITIIYILQLYSGRDISPRNFFQKKKKQSILF